MEFQSLKSGSDVRGIAIGEDAVLTDQVAKQLGRAFTHFVSEKRGIPIEQVKIAVGRDCRISGPSLLAGVCDGVSSTGAQAVDCGMCTTPSMYTAILTQEFQPTGSVMLTASHHPWRLNGLKFFLKEGGLSFSDLDQVLAIAQKLSPDAEAKPENISNYPFIKTYQEHLRQIVLQGLKTDNETPLEGMHIIVDAGNGAGGFYADLLKSLGANTEGSQFLDPDGHFPNHAPNPENKEAMASISAAVLKSGADLGFIFDTDCDRAAIVDHEGKEINRNRLIALISAIILEKRPGATIVTDSVTSSGLASFIKDCGGVHYRYKRGYRNVIDEAIRLNEEGIDCPLAIETSGHAAMRENQFLDDGMYLVTYMLIKAIELKKSNQTLSSLIDDLKEPVESTELRLPVLTKVYSEAEKATIHLVLEHAATQDDWHIAPDNREGVRVNFDLKDGKENGWFLLRLSVHDPVMPLNIESDIEGGVAIIVQKLYELFKSVKEVDISVLAKNN